MARSNAHSDRRQLIQSLAGGDEQLKRVLGSKSTRQLQKFKERGLPAVLTRKQQLVMG